MMFLLPGNFNPVSTGNSFPQDNKMSTSKSRDQVFKDGIYLESDRFSHVHMIMRLW